MKVKITMEADVTDLPAYDTTDGAGKQNVFDLLMSLETSALQKLIEQETVEKVFEPAMQKALIETYADEVEIVSKLLKSMEIKFEE